MDKRVITFSLWGDIPKYTIGAIKNVSLAQMIYNGWICRFYCGASVPKDIISTLDQFDNVELVFPEIEEEYNNLFWRFLAIDDPDVEVMISRDTDSRLSSREKAAVDEWLTSDKGFHIMRDHIYHAIEIPGGMFGCKRGTINNITEQIKNHNKSDEYYTDEVFLIKTIWPQIKNNYLAHDAFGCLDRNSFPTKRIGNEFVGKIFDENDKTIKEHELILEFSSHLEL